MAGKSYRELQDQIEALQAQADELREKELGDAKAKILELMADFNITVEDLGAKRGRPRGARSTRKTNGEQQEPRRPVPAKFKDPESGRTWSGRGRAPQWLTGERSKYEIPQTH